MEYSNLDNVVVNNVMQYPHNKMGYYVYAIIFLDLLFNEIAFEFKYDLDPVGILFFAENNATDEKLLIQMTGEELVFEYSNVDTTMKAVSPVTLCRGCWFRVIATR